LDQLPKQKSTAASISGSTLAVSTKLRRPNSQKQSIRCFAGIERPKVCFAQLEDVSKEPERKVIEVESNSEFVTPPPSPLPARAFLPESRWFKRGWTLQELIAPKPLERARVAKTTALEELQLDASFYHAEALCNPVTSYIFCQSSVDVVFVAKVGESIGRRALYDSATV
jgi:hypothetical protein